MIPHASDPSTREVTSSGTCPSGMAEAVRAIETRWRPGRPHAPLVEGLLPRWTGIAPRDSAGTKDPFRPSDRRVWGCESERDTNQFPIHPSSSAPADRA
jgi:hypothetical protein